MNRKFTTLMAKAMLVLAFLVGATSMYAADFAVGDNVLISTGSSSDSDGSSTTSYLGINSYGLITTVTDLSSLSNINEAVWKVTAVNTVYGQTAYTLTHKLTGVVFAIDASIADAGTTFTTLGGSATEWVDDTNLVSYLEDETTYVQIATDDDGNYVVISGSKDDSSSDSSEDSSTGDTSSSYTAVTLSLTAVSSVIDEPINLTYDDLNTLLGTNASSASFTLNFDPNVSDGYTNLFTATELEAEDAGYIADEDGNATPLVTLKSEGNGYIYVTTSVIGDNHSDGELLGYGYIEDLEDLDDLDYSSTTTDDEGNETTTTVAGLYRAQFLFTYDVSTGYIYIQVRQVAYYYDEDDALIDGITAYSADDVNSVVVVEKPYIYMDELAGTYVLTVNTDDTYYGEAKDKADQRTTITIETTTSALELTTLAEGVYTIQNSDGKYAIANLAGAFGWAEQAVNQNYAHMPAAQWVVAQNGTTTTATVTFANREFPLDEYVDADGNTIVPATSTQLYASEDGTIYYYAGSTKTAVTFTEVEAAETDGYLYVTADQAKVNVYTFNYLHGLSLDAYLYTEDGGSVKVDTESKTAYRLNVVVADDNYGYEDGLVRNVYTIESMSGDGYLTYDEDNNKYVIGSTPGYFFLKENNCIAGDDEDTHYYALVEARLAYLKSGGALYDVKYAGLTADDGIEKVTKGDYTLAYAEGGSLVVADAALPELYGYKLNSETGVVELTDLGEDRKAFYYDDDNAIQTAGSSSTTYATV